MTAAAEPHDAESAPRRVRLVAAPVRCPAGVLHFKVLDGDRIEVKCDHWKCTDGGRFVVLHRFSFDGEPLDTKKFTDPAPRGRRARRNHKEGT